MNSHVNNKITLCLIQSSANPINYGTIDSNFVKTKATKNESNTDSMLN